jgi:hypothetical protein
MKKYQNLLLPKIFNRIQRLTGKQLRSIGLTLIIISGLNFFAFGQGSIAFSCNDPDPDVTTTTVCQGTYPLIDNCSDAVCDPVTDTVYCWWVKKVGSNIFVPVEGNGYRFYTPVADDLDEGPGTYLFKRWYQCSTECDTTQTSYIGFSNDVTLEVIPNNTVSTASSTPTLCINTAINPAITHTTTGATGISNSGVSGANSLPAGVSATWSANTITISGTPTESGTFNYSILLTEGCGTVNATGTIIVTPNNTVSTASSTPTLCINTAINPAITHTTTGATGISNSGVSGANSLPAGVSATWSANTITISGTPTESGTFNYSILLTEGCGTVNATGTIIVTPNNTVSTASSTPTLCINTAINPAITHTTTGATGISNSGVSGANSLPAGVSATWSANTITISGTPTESGTFNYSILLTEGCGTVNATGTIIVTPNNTVSIASSTPTLCINTAINPAITHTTTGATGIGTATGLPVGVIATWASNTITISGTPTASGQFNYSVPLTGGCGTVSATGTITVTPNNTVTSGVNTSICINTEIDPAITHTTTGATGIGTATGLPVGVTATWASNTITISGTPTASGQFNYSIPLTGGCGTVSAIGTITVASSVNTTITISANPGNQICSGTPITFSASVNTTGNYQWKLNNQNVGINSSTYSNPNLSNGDIVKCVFTSTATCASPQEVTSIPITMSVTPNPGVANNTTITTPMCGNGTTRTLTGTPAGGTFSIESGPGSINGNIYTAYGSGNAVIRYTIAAVGYCPATYSEIIIPVTAYPGDANNTTQTTAMCGNGTTRTLTGTPTGGTFNLVTGPGIISGNIYTASGSGNAVIRYTLPASGPCPATNSDIIIPIISYPGDANNTTYSTHMCGNGSTRTLTGTPSGGAFSLVSGPGSISGNVYTASGSGNAVIRYTLPASGPCPATNSDIIIQVTTYTGDANNTTYSTPMCGNGSTRTLTGTPIGGTFSLVSGPGSISGNVYTASGSGNAVIRYTIAAVGPCPATENNDTILINPVPLISGDFQICNKTIDTLYASTPPSNSPWSSNNINVATILYNGVVLTKQAGTTNIVYKDINGCTDTKELTVLPLPVPIIAISESSGTTQNDGKTCSGDHVILSASSSVGTSPFTYKWNTGVTKDSIEVRLGYSPQNYNYFVAMTDSLGCKKESDPIGITVYDNPISIPKIDLLGKTSLFHNQLFSLKGENSEQGQSNSALAEYRWEITPSNLISNYNSLNLSLANLENIKVQSSEKNNQLEASLIVEDQNGCKNHESIEFTSRATNSCQITISNLKDFYCINEEIKFNYEFKASEGANFEERTISLTKEAKINNSSVINVTSNTGSFSIIYNGIGAFVVDFYIKDNLGCEERVNKKVEVLKKPDLKLISSKSDTFKNINDNYNLQLVPIDFYKNLIVEYTLITNQTKTAEFKLVSKDTFSRGFVYGDFVEGVNYLILDKLFYENEQVKDCATILNDTITIIKQGCNSIFSDSNSNFPKPEIIKNKLCSSDSLRFKIHNIRFGEAISGALDNPAYNIYLSRNSDKSKAKQNLVYTKNLSGSLDKSLSNNLDFEIPASEILVDSQFYIWYEIKPRQGDSDCIEIPHAISDIIIIRPTPEPEIDINGISQFCPNSSEISIKAIPSKFVSVIKNGYSYKWESNSDKIQISVKDTTGAVLSLDKSFSGSSFNLKVTQTNTYTDNKTCSATSPEVIIPVEDGIAPDKSFVSRYPGHLYFLEDTTEDLCVQWGYYEVDNSGNVNTPILIPTPKYKVSKNGYAVFGDENLTLKLERNIGGVLNPGAFLWADTWFKVGNTCTYEDAKCPTRNYYNASVPPKNTPRSTEDKNECTIFPNPSNGSFILSVEGDWVGNYDVDIFDYTGSIVTSGISMYKYLFRTELPLNIESLQEGLYIVRLKNSEGISKFYKVQKF